MLANPQFDAEYYELEKEFGVQWVEDDAGTKGNFFYGANPDFLDILAHTTTAAQMIETDFNLGRIVKTGHDP